MSSTLARHVHRSRSRRRSTSRRRRLTWAVGLALLAGIALALALGPIRDAIREVTLPLRHDDIIRQQARTKGVDADLIAAVIYEESKFRDQTSHAGARGLMQITPRTADFIARRSGGTRFKQGDLATPQINIAFGTYYLRYLIERYDGNESLAVAAYNAGETNVDKWVRRAGGPGSFDVDRDIPFPETRHYIHGVQKHRKDYLDHYADDLGL
ncbi:MAG TPA: lytic transglycosylase domain-containing protein [Thermoleophilaceae bacterium]|nr:lytic transglycosylase domain-containing protein [Thermoleophilaceae bacterium]